MKIRTFAIVLLSTFFYLGYFPFIPGTAATLAGIGIFYLVRGRIFVKALLALIFLLLGFYLSGKAEKILKRKDAPQIVIDEVAGIFISLMFLPYDIKLVVVAFVLFRIFDTLKPYPIDKIQNLGGSLGIMGDDVVSGIYTNIVLQLALRFTCFMIS